VKIVVDPEKLALALLPIDRELLGSVERAQNPGLLDGGHISLLSCEPRPGLSAADEVRL
jgi:hypothetical protein